MSGLISGRREERQTWGLQCCNAIHFLLFFQINLVCTYCTYQTKNITQMTSESSRVRSIAWYQLPILPLTGAEGSLRAFDDSCPHITLQLGLFWAGWGKAW